jgi:hypothetical protein
MNLQSDMSNMVGTSNYQIVGNIFSPLFVRFANIVARKRFFSPVYCANDHDELGPGDPPIKNLRTSH